MEDNMKKCKHCGTAMSAEAKICPNCKKRQKLTWWQITLIVIGVIILLNLFTSPSDENEGNQNDNSINNNTTTENVVTNDVQKQEKDTYSVGETFNDGYMSVKYSALNENFTGYSQYATVKPGYKVVCASFEFENISTTDQLASSYNFSCYADGYDCENFYYVDDSSFSANLSSGKKTKGNVYFEVPESSTSIVIEYENNIWTSSKIKFIVK